MLGRRAWTLLAVGSAAALLAWQGCGSSDTATVAPSAPPAPSAASLPAPPLAAGLLREQIPADQAVSGIGLEASPAAAAPPPGALRGFLLDATGRPLAGARLGLVFATDPLARRMAQPDASGYYEAPELTPGAWRLALSLKGPRRRGCQVSCGAVDVPSGATLWRDVRLEGSRSATGVFRMENQDGLVLTLLLRRVAEPSSIVARAETVLSEALERRELAREAAFARGVAAEDPGDAAPDATSGEFWFGGLAPDLYELEIRLDADGRLAQRRRVELTRGDADLGVERLRWEDFLP